MPDVVFSGLYNTSHYPDNLVDLSYSDMIRYTPHGSSPLFAITTLMGEETCLQTTHGYWTKTMVFPEVIVNGAITTETTIGVDSTATIIPGMVLINNTTGERMIVEAVPTATTMTVKRNMGGTNFAVIADNEVLVEIGNINEEASDRPQNLNVNPVEITNITQIFRTSWALSGTSRAVKLIAGNDTETESRADCSKFHALSIEKALIFSKKHTDVYKGQPRRAMDGIISVIGNPAYYPPIYGGNVNIWDASGGSLGRDGDSSNNSLISYAELEEMLDVCFYQASDPGGNPIGRVLYCGSKAIRAINTIGINTGQYRLIDGQTNFGLKFKTLTMPRGEFKLVEHPLFNTNHAWRKMILGIDQSYFKVAYLTGRKTHFEEYNTKGDIGVDFGKDAIGGSITTEMTCLVKNPPANVVIYNMAA